MAMGLASMNPMAGAATGAIMIRQKPDKDLETDPWSNYTVTRGFDNDSMLGMDNGKLVFKKTKDLKECKIYIIKHPNTDKIFDALVEEALKENQSYKPDPGFIYSAFTGNYLLTDDQFDYDPLLERVYLDKLSKRLNADATNLENEYSQKELNKHEGYYPVKKVGDEDDASTNFPLLAHAQMDQEQLDLLEAYFNKIMTGEGEEIVDDI